MILNCRKTVILSLLTIIVLLSSLTFCSCNKYSYNIKEEIIGVWLSDLYKSEGYIFEQKISFDYIGNFTWTTFRNGSIASVKKGYYIIEENRVKISIDSEENFNNYLSWVKGRLYSDDLAFTKQ